LAAHPSWKSLFSFLLSRVNAGGGSHWHTLRKNGADVTKISAAEEENFFRRQENKNTMSALLPWHV